jgi:hypothetical protein
MDHLQDNCFSIQYLSYSPYLGITRQTRHHRTADSAADSANFLVSLLKVCQASSRESEK